MYQVISFYQYTHLADPEQLRDQLKEYCQNNQILGRILIGTEGLNGAVCGEKNQVEKFKQFLTQNPIFADLTFREQETETNAYHKLVIKVRQEICAFGAPVDVAKNKGIHLPPQQLKQWYEQNEDFMIVDARNEYEFAVGRFKNAVKLPIQNFREFPEQALKELAPHKEKKIVLYCTGGIRCEKASAYLKEQGFPQVYQIEGGIINYVNQHPNTFWEGGLFVFDDRLVSDLGSPITFCKICEKDCEQYTNCHNLDCDKLFICCAACQQNMKNTCSEECMNASRHRKVQNKADQKKIVGIVENYYSKAQVALIKTIHPLNIYSNISISGNTTKDVIQEVTEMRTYDGEEIPFAPEGSYITIPIKEKIRKNDKVALC
ncbi:MAG TPA: rhodanese-related sulfurtransferase [Candidatus Nanoarchaeia archaeon]|nr:rhodanese-related sulfurtransferase [Candidatus Nanoarchaeia archaeon]